MIFADEHEICDDEIQKAIIDNKPNDFGGYSVTTGGK